MTRTRFNLAALGLILVAGFAQAGKPAPAKGTYPFALTPDQAYEKLAALEPASGRKLALTREEAHLFADARDGTLDSVSFADACLIASGVTDREKRQAYRDKLDEIEAAARKAVEGTRTVPEAAEQLLKFLHAGPMAKGYEAHQTDLHTILDTGKYNCVSSAALYNVIGRRLGLELRAVEIPGHVFSVLCDGDKRIDVETTNARGFDPADKDKSAKERHAGHRREVGETGLAAIVAYNHGVELSNAKRFQEAALANVRALALDSTNPSAAKNAVADLTNWPLELAKAGEFETALAVLAVGLELAPNEAGLTNNHKVIWAEYADARMKAGKPDEAVAVLRRAAKAVTGEDFESRQAYLFARPADTLMHAEKWDDALKLIDTGIKAVDPKAQKTLREMRVGLFLRWAQTEEKKGQFASALTILKRAASEESDNRIKNNTLVVYDTWADGHRKRGEWTEAIQVYERGLTQLPGDKHLANNLAYCREQMKK
jgi:tetratricopeptide (TPR) repeat protein